jgi:hypothetical protein
MKETIVCIIALAMVLMVGEFAQAEVSREGLIAEYLFNGNANDTSGNENHGIVYGPTLTQDRFGNANSAYSFDGNDDNIVVQDSDSLDVTSQITIEAWVNIAGHHSGQHYVVDSRDGIGGGYGLNVDTDTIQFWIGDSWPTFNFGIEPGEWHHVVGTYDGNRMKMYIDGVMKANIAFTATFAPSAGSLYIGTFWQGPGQFFSGDMDEVAIWKRILTPQEVLERYEAAWPPPALVGYWKFDEDSGDIAYDSSDYGNDGLISGATWVEGKCGSGLYFDGAADDNLDYVLIPDQGPMSIDTNTFTISFWVKLFDLDRHHSLLDKRHGYHLHNYWFAFYDSGTPPSGDTGDYLIAGINDGTISTSAYDEGPYARVDDPPRMEPNVFYFVTATYNQSSGDFILYLDGNVIGMKNLKLSNPIIGDGDLYFGAHPVHGVEYATDGIIDEVRIYNYVLTQEQIRADMETCVPPADLSGCIKLKGSPLDRAKVILKVQGNKRQITETDEHGCFEIESVGCGKWMELRIKKKTDQ